MTGGNLIWRGILATPITVFGVVLGTVCYGRQATPKVVLAKDDRAIIATRLNEPTKRSVLVFAGAMDMEYYRRINVGDTLLLVGPDMLMLDNPSEYIKKINGKTMRQIKAAERKSAKEELHKTNMKKSWKNIDTLRREMSRRTKQKTK